MLEGIPNKWWNNKRKELNFPSLRNPLNGQWLRKRKAFNLPNSGFGLKFPVKWNGNHHLWPGETQEKGKNQGKPLQIKN